jgi:uncharacterized protein with GYD domain
MKLLLENWRLYSGEYDFNILCENYDQKRITDAEVLMLWEAQIVRSQEALINEGVMDILQIGWEKSKELGGKAKEAWNSALDKLNNWYLEVTAQAYQLIMKGIKGIAKMGAVLKRAYDFMKKWCKAHPIMCTIVKILIIMLILLAVSQAAQAKVDIASMPGQDPSAGPKDLGERGGNMLKGILGDMTKYDSAFEIDADVHESARAAFDLLEKAEQSDTWLDLANSTEEGAELLRDCYAQVQDLIGQVKETGEGWNLLARLGQQGERVMRATIDLTTNASAQAKKIQSLSVVP